MALLILFVVGIILLLGRKECIKDENNECVFIKKRRFNLSKQMLGFVLGLVNPTVLIYWVLVISFLNSKMFYLNSNIEKWALVLFVFGVFFGKTITLYAYGKLSHLLKTKMKSITTRINRIIGILLICVSVFQVLKLI